MKLGYARVSTMEQNLDLQLEALRLAGCQRLYQEKLSGASRQRPEFQRMLEQLRDGDTVVVWKLDRLARSTRDLLATIDTIRETGGTFVSLSEPRGRYHDACRQDDHDDLCGHCRVRA